MLVAYLILTSLTALGCAVGAWMNLVGHPVPVAAAEQVHVPRSWMRPLGTLLGVGALGLVAGLVVPVLGVAAAAGLVLYFVGAVGAHLRVRDTHVARAVAALVVTGLTLTVTVSHRLG